MLSNKRMKSAIRLFCVSSMILVASQTMASVVSTQLPTSMQQIELSFAPLVKQAAPAVVNIYSTRKIRIREVSPFLNDPVFRHFFGNTFGGAAIKERQENSLGSGVIVKGDGLIITSNHVIDKSDEIKVVLSDRREFAAKVILADEKTDLALLKIQIPSTENLPYLELANSDELQVGDLVLAIGNPFGVGQTVTSGIVSALARTTLGVSDYQFFIQTDAAINPGNSGGALLTMSGKLAGINTAIYTRSGGSNGIGFAIPANMVATVIDSSAGGGQVIRPWTGITTEEVTQEIANSLGLNRPHGALVKAVYPDSSADDAGILVGDIIFAIDNHELNDHHELEFRIATYRLDTTSRFTLLRNGKYMAVTVNMEAPIESPKRDLRLLTGHQPLAGSTVANLSPAVALDLDVDVTGLDKGVVVTNIEDGTAAKRLGIQRKDIILQVNDVAVESTKQLQTLLKQNPERYKLRIRRGSRAINVILGRQF